MLDRTHYDSWSQRIRLYCRGKENRIYILQSIDHGPFELGTTRDTLGTTPKRGVLLGPEKPRTYDHLNENEEKRFDTDVHQSSPKKTESQLYDEFKCFKMLLGENINEYYVRFHKLVNYIRNIRMTMPNIQLNSKFVNNMSPEWDRMFRVDRIRIKGTLLGKMNCTQPKRQQNSDYFMDKMLLMQAQENGAVLDEEDLLFLTREQTNNFDVDVAGLTNQQAGPSNASTLSEVHDLENAIDPCDDNQAEHEIHHEVQHKNTIDSTMDDMGNSNVTSYEQYLSVNDISVVPSFASSISNDAYVLHDNNAYVPHDPLVTKLNIYKEQVAIYEQCARFELTLRKQKIDEQMSILIRDRNQKEENLKKELHSLKLQLNSTIQNNKIIEENVTALKQEFKQKETKFLTDFSNLKNLKDKLENKLYSQDQSIQTVHMMLKPIKSYKQNAEIAIGVQNPFYLKHAKRAQPAFYDGNELLKPHHVLSLLPHLRKT
uniref:Integrase, catalytic region, zinc finger, CCHC-type, peptidase aspartic, catalytic n=1 Tax=Tanacetum cinerariifolium TaxID=118510 RepID=A0A6L2LTC2_TANCI|nr:hypothetical protein [Tanacetum cinerariifolium]